MKTLLLVQENSRCIELLTGAFQKKLLLTEDDALFVWQIKDVFFSDEQSFISNGQEQISIKDISLVIKRTWGPIREQGLAICKRLEGMNVKILNGCDFIEWSHSKIQQYITLSLKQKADLFPKTVYIDHKTIESLIKQTTKDNLAKALLDQMYPVYKFPMVLKKDNGCRADGVYLIDSLDNLKELLLNDFDSLRKGFLLQEFINSHTNPEISNYYRINVVSGKAQSAIQFQLIWKKIEACAALKLVDFKESEQIPVDLEIFPPKRLQEIVDACLPCRQDVVGIDVMFNNGQIYLLEYNDGPAVGLIVELGEKYLNSDIPEQINAAKSCHNFATSIADACLELASPYVINKQQKMTFEFDKVKAKPEMPLLDSNSEDQEANSSNLTLSVK